MRYFRVKNFEKLQHYKDRCPPWIKLYNSILDDYDFHLLPCSTRFHLVAIWLLASRNDNRIAWDEKWIAAKIGAPEDKIDLKTLLSRGYVEMYPDASTPLAECSGDWALEQSRDREETEQSSTPDGVASPDEPIPARKPRVDTSAVARLRDIFKRGWRERYGVEYVWTHGKEDAQIKTLMGQLGGFEPAKGIIRRFLEDDDAWLTDKRHALSLIFSRVNRYRGESPQKNTNGFVCTGVTKDDDYLFDPPATEEPHAA